jgi:arylsulfatase A-like enzyme
MSLHQREIHVPLLMRVGGRDLDQTARVTHPVSTLDIVPTVLDWQGIDYESKKLVGTSLLSEQPHPGVMAFWRGQTVVMDENWKLYYDDEPIALFEISRDPTEKNNLLESQTSRAQEMAREADAHQALGKEMETETERIIERLKAIGYLN